MDHRETRAPELVAIVVLNLNEKAKTLRCLSSVAELDYSPYEVVLVDNGSTDGSVEAIAQVFPHIHVVRNPCNLGVAGGRNRGIAYANKHFPYGYLLFLDNDAWLERSALRELVRVMQSDPQVGLASPKIYQAGAPMVLAGAGGHRINWYTGTIRTVGAGEVDRGQYDGNHPITCSGSGVLVRRAVFERIGGLDDAFNPYGWEDLDFSLRARAAGFGIRFVPTAITHHEGGKAGRGRALPEYEESKTKNFFLIMKRHATRVQWACFLCVFPIRAAWRTVGELCSGRWDVVLAHGRGFVRALRKSAPHSGDSGRPRAL